MRSNIEWMRGEAKSIALCSRIRLARNLRQQPFPGWSKKADRERIYQQIQPSLAALPEMEQAIINDPIDRFTQTQRQILVEQHIISREHASKSAGSGLAVNKNKTISIMVNEEDHLRIQVFRSGSSLKPLWKLIDKIDNQLDQSLDFAFHHEIGYLTACPSNVGTGMRASVMMHLPGLVISDQMGQIIKAVNKIGLAVRGLYGEGTEALGNLFQISNQMTLGDSEINIIERLNKVIDQVVEHETNARIRLMQERARLLADQIGRAYGIMLHAYSITSKEALNLLSLLRLGMDLNFFPDTISHELDELFIRTQPGHLQMDLEKKLSSEERDALRADLLRSHLGKCPTPKFPI